MYSPRLYKYRDSYVLYIPTVHAFGSVSLTHTLLVKTHIHDVSAPWFKYSSFLLPIQHIVNNLNLQMCFAQYLQNLNDHNSRVLD